jgi:cyclophilin family peptidyl-prolyl cis-trans isomerase
MTATRLLLVLLLVLTATPPPKSAERQAAPVLIIDTARGQIEFETYPDDAPKTVAHIVSLVQRGFYDGQRFHRAIPGFLVQFGDPQTRELQKRVDWGRGDAASSGTPVGAVETTKQRRHTKGAVGLSHHGDPKLADSQIYVTLADRPDLDGKYAVFGHVISGMDVLQKIQVGDVITRMTVRNTDDVPGTGR